MIVKRHYLTGKEGNQTARQKEPDLHPHHTFQKSHSFGYRLLIPNGADGNMPIFIYEVQGYTISVHRGIIARGSSAPAGLSGKTIRWRW